MGSMIEIHIATVDEKTVEGIALDIVEFLKHYPLTATVKYIELHKRFVLQ